MTDARLKELRARLMRLLDHLELGSAPPPDLPDLLLKADHALRSQEERLGRTRASLGLHLKELQRRLDQLGSVRALSEFLATHGGSDEIFDLLPEFLLGSFAAEQASLMLLDPEVERLEIVGAGGQMPRAGSNLRLKPGEGLAGWVLQQGRSYLCPDVSIDPQFRLIEGEEAQGSLLCAPLKSAGKVFGVLNLSSRQAGAFSDDEENLLNLLAEPIALAINRARLYESFHRRVQEQTRELEDVRDFFQSIVNSSDDLIVVLSPDFEMILVSTVLESLLGHHVDGFINREPDGYLLEPRDAAELKELLGRGEVVRDRDIQLLHAEGRQVHVSLNASPIRSQGKDNLGYLCIFRSIERRVRIHQELTRLNTRLNSLFESAVDISSSLDRDQVITRALGWISGLIDADEATLLLLGPDRRHLICQSLSDPETRIRKELANCPEGVVIQQQRPLLLAEPAAVRQFLPEAGRRLQSCIMVPLKVQDHVLGVLRMDSHNPARCFTFQDLRLSSTFATQAALALENSRLYSTTRLESSRLRGLLDLSSKTSSARSPQAVLQLFASSVLELTDAQAVVAWEIRPEEQQLRRACTLCQDLELDSGKQVLSLHLPEDDQLHYLLSHRERRLRLNPLPEILPPWAPAARAENIALLVVPVVDEQNVHGLLVLYHDEWHLAEEEDESFISLLAYQAASSIRMQTLFQENLTARDFLSSVVSSANDAIIVTDRRGRISLFNTGAERMLLHEAGSMLGKTVESLYPEATDVITDLRKGLKDGSEHVSLETELRRNDGQLVPVQLSLNWMRNARGRITGVLGVAKDVSELRKLEAARLEAERLSGIERMAVTVSDRINSPLSAILLKVELIRMIEGQLGRQSKDSLDVIEEQISVIKSILDQLNHLDQNAIKDYALPELTMYDLDASARQEVENPPPARRKKTVKGKKPVKKTAD
jgi:PAS domain S-box-containing protein